MRFLLFLLLVYLCYRQFRIWAGKKSGRSGESRRGGEADGTMLKDPVCGVYFPEKDRVSLKVGGKVLHFCSEECRDRYLADNR